MVMVAAGGAGWTWAVEVFLEADAPRVSCTRHGVTVVAVP
jgi:hypothetical protein